jgi:hypothetical protein
MMRTFLAAVMAVVALAGCVSPRGKTIYEKPSVSQTQKEADEAACTKAALDTAEGPRGSAFLAVDRDAVDQCMQARGYRVTAPK